MYIIGYDIGGTKCAAILARTDGDDVYFIARDEIATSSRYSDVLDALAKLSLAQLKNNNLSFADVEAGGVSCGGPLCGKEGLILSPPNLPGWDNVPVCRIMREKTGVSFYLKNDADACAVAEWKYGAGKGFDNIIFLTFGTGLGAGLILNGKLYSGASDTAGECGHVRLEQNGPVGYGKAGSFEGFCSGGGIKQLADGYYSALAVAPDYWKGKGSLSAKDVAVLAKNGDAHAIKIYEICGDYFGRGLAVLIDILNPDMIIVGGVYMRDGDLIQPTMRASLERECLPQSLNKVQIVKSGLGERIGDYGAVVAALNY